MSDQYRPGDDLPPGPPPTAAAKMAFGERIAAAAAARRRRSASWRKLPKPARIVIGVLGVAVLYYLPYLDFSILRTPKADFVSVLAAPVAVYVIVALGLNVVVGMAGLLDLGYVGFYAVGAYTLAVVGSAHASLPWLLCLPVAVAVSMLSGLLLGAPTLRLRGDYLAIVTLGFGEIIRLLAERFDWLGAKQGFSGIAHPPKIGPIEFGVLDSRSFYWLGLTAAICVYYLLGRLENSRVGRAWTAIREDEDAAELMGVPTFKFKLWAFAIGAGVGGLAGTLYASKGNYVAPDLFQLKVSILFLAAVVLGGPGNRPGVVVGAIVVSYLPDRFRFLDTSRYFWFGVVLVVLMIFRPQGLWPRRQHGRRSVPPSQAPPPFEDVKEGDPDLEGGAHGAATPA
ncbi:MAG TPA: branched-chain amino acid ABC transporter permease [Ilumatobacteraceae bacterium]|nr:branched-chain amino acid ABC transporter permease [Ilumatobacteraceae bacterium]